MLINSQVDWDREKQCFEQFSRECSSFYGLQHDPFLLDSMEPDEQKVSSCTNDGGDGESAGSTSHLQTTEAEYGQDDSGESKEVGEVHSQALTWSTNRDNNTTALPLSL